MSGLCVCQHDHSRLTSSIATQKGAGVLPLVAEVLLEEVCEVDEVSSVLSLCYIRTAR